MITFNLKMGLRIPIVDIHGLFASLEMRSLSRRLIFIVENQVIYASVQKTWILFVSLLDYAKAMKFTTCAY